MVSIRTLEEPALVPCIFYELHLSCTYILLQDAVTPGTVPEVTVVFHAVCSESTGAAIRRAPLAPCAGDNTYLRQEIAESRGDGLCIYVASRSQNVDMSFDAVLRSCEHAKQDPSAMKKSAAFKAGMY